MSQSLCSLLCLTSFTQHYVLSLIHDVAGGCAVLSVQCCRTFYDAMIKFSRSVLPDTETIGHV